MLFLIFSEFFGPDLMSRLAAIMASYGDGGQLGGELGNSKNED